MCKKLYDLKVNNINISIRESVLFKNKSVHKKDLKYIRLYSQVTSLFFNFKISFEYRSMCRAPSQELPRKKQNINSYGRNQLILKIE